MRVLITGGTGFLGAYLARHLVKNVGLDGVVLFDRFPNYARVADLSERLTVVAGDILEPQELLAALKRHAIERVIHLAFILGPPDPEKLVPYLRVQCIGTANVFEAARIHGAARVVYASSVAVYGVNPTGAPSLDEDAPPAPDSYYGICKLFGEQIAERYALDHGLDLIGLRPCAVFGMGRAERTGAASGLVLPGETPHFMAAPELALRGEPVELPAADLVVDWCYAADAAEAWYRALVAPKPAHRVFNLRAEQRPVGDFAAHLRRRLPEAVIRTGERPARSLQLMKNDRIRAEFDFRPRFTIESGLDDYLARARAGELR